MPSILDLSMVINFQGRFQHNLGIWQFYTICKNNTTIDEYSKFNSISSILDLSIIINFQGQFQHNLGI